MKMMVTEKEQNDSINKLTYACLLYLYQAEIDAFEFKREGLSVYEKRKFEFAIDDARKAVSDELEAIFGAYGGICNEGSNQYTEFTNKIHASMPDFVNHETMISVLSYQMHTYAASVGKKKISKRTENLSKMLLKYIDKQEVIDSLKAVSIKTREAMDYFFGTYSEQVKAIKEYNDQIKEHDPARIL